MPPYEFRDKESGQVIWDNIDAKPGERIEIFANATRRISPNALVRPEGTTTPPPVEPPPVEPPPVEPPPTEPPPQQPPVSSGTLLRPANETELAQALQYAADNNGTCLLSQVKIDLTKTLRVQCRGNAGSLWGVIGNGSRLVWKGPAGGDMLAFAGAQAGDAFETNRGLLIEKLTLDGQGGARNCLTLRADRGDQGSIYKSALRDIYTFGGTTGIVLEGAVFESYLDNVHAENHVGDGMITRHLPDYNGRRNIISNINIVHPNFSRNKGAGLRCEYSTNLTFGSFVLNAKGGVYAAQGLRYAVGCNGENTGRALFVVEHNGYGSYISGNEVSSDGSTHYRAFEGGRWVSYGEPCLYLLDCVVNNIALGDGNHCSYYGGGSNPMRLVK